MNSPEPLALFGGTGLSGGCFGTSSGRRVGVDSSCQASGEGAQEISDALGVGSEIPFSEARFLPHFNSAAVFGGADFDHDVIAEAHEPSDGDRFESTLLRVHINDLPALLHAREINGDR